MTAVCAVAVAGLALRLWPDDRTAVRAAAGAVCGSVGFHLLVGTTGYCVSESQYHDSASIHVLGLTQTVNGSYGIAVVGGALFGAGLLYLARAAARRLRLGAAVRAAETRGNFGSPAIVPVLLLLPTLVHILMFTYTPAAQLLRTGTLVARLGIDRTAPACLSNYSELLTGRAGGADYYILSDGSLFRSDGADFSGLVFRSLTLTVMIVTLTNVVALAISWFAFRRFRGATVYRVLLIWPFVLSPVASAIIMRAVFATPDGFIDQAFEMFGKQGPEFLLDSTLGLFAVAITASWNIIGFNILFYVAALQNVPTHLLEAAELDGASRWGQFRHVVLSSIAPIVLFLVFFNTVYSLFDTFGIIQNQTSQGPVVGTENLIYNIYDQGILAKDLGRAAAQSIVLMLIAGAVGILQFRTSDRRITYAQ